MLREFGEDPVGGSDGSGVGREVGIEAGEGAAVVESDQLGDGGLDAIGGEDVAEGIGDAEVGEWAGGRWNSLGGGEGGGIGRQRATIGGSARRVLS